MLFLSVVVGTIGLVMIVPAILQAIDGEPLDVVVGTVAFAATAFGIAGLMASQFEARFLVQLGFTLLASAAAGALHREILTMLRPEPLEAMTPETDTEPSASV